MYITDLRTINRCANLYIIQNIKTNNFTLLSRDWILKWVRIMMLSQVVLYSFFPPLNYSEGVVFKKKMIATCLYFYELVYIFLSLFQRFFI